MVEKRRIRHKRQHREAEATSDAPRKNSDFAERNDTNRRHGEAKGSAGEGRSAYTFATRAE
jgi:hypothetical protein